MSMSYTSSRGKVLSKGRYRTVILYVGPCVNCSRMTETSPQATLWDLTWINNSWFDPFCNRSWDWGRAVPHGERGVQG